MISNFGLYSICAKLFLFFGLIHDTSSIYHVQEPIASVSKDFTQDNYQCSLRNHTLIGEHLLSTTDDNIIIGVVTSKESKSYVMNKLHPFLSKYNPDKGVDRLYFTNDVWPELPSVVDNDLESSYRTAQIRFMDAFNYMTNCWKESPPRWFFMNDDDAAVSAFRSKQFVEMLESEYGSPDDVPYFLGMRNPWFDTNGSRLHFFGGNGLLLSRALLMKMRSIPSAAWADINEELKNDGFYEPKFYNFLDQHGILKGAQRGPFLHRPFGFGDAKTGGDICQQDVFCMVNPKWLGCDVAKDSQAFNDQIHYLQQSSMLELRQKYGQNTLDTVIVVHKLDRNKPIPRFLYALFEFKPSVKDYQNLLCDWNYINGGQMTHEGCGECPDHKCIDSWTTHCGYEDIHLISQSPDKQVVSDPNFNMNEWKKNHIRKLRLKNANYLRLRRITYEVKSY